MALSKITNDGIDNITIDSSGNVGIGTSSPNADLELGGTGEIMRLSGSSTNAYIRNTDGTTNQWYIGSGGNAGLQHYIYQAQPMTFHTNGSERMRILSSGGLTFNGDTASANALDDYEEGTWTPTLEGSISNPTITYSEQTGTYTKIGQFVFITLRIHVATTSGGGGNLTISGIPFAAKSYSGSVAGALTKGFVYNLATDIDTMFVFNGNSDITLYSSDNNNTQNQVSSLQNSCFITASGCYQAD